MTVKEILLPDIGDFDEVDVIEILVSAGDVVTEEQSLLTLESDKATMEIPSPYAGTIQAVSVSVGDKISKAALLATIESTEVTGDAPEAIHEPAPAVVTADVPPPATPAAAPAPTPPLEERRQIIRDGSPAHASPSVRRFARELGVDLHQVSGSGPKNRILRQDIKSFVKGMLSGDTGGSGSGLQVDPMPVIDFAKFGPIETQPLSRIQKKSGANLHRSWVTVPHVTQFDEADITDLEDFRRSQKGEADKRGIKLTFLSFLMKAAVAGLKEFPQFNTSLSSDGESLIVKQYYHIGIAVDTPEGLVVPVVRDVDQKGVFDIAGELMKISVKARDKKLMPGDMQGGTFSISSLGGIGGTAFTPIVNAPEVAILGVARSKKQPVYQGDELVPRMILPFCISYDHRVIDGAAAARFTSYMSAVLSDIQRLLL